MSGDDLDRFYHHAGEQDSVRPSPAVRQAIFERAREIAAQPRAQAPSVFTRWFGHRPWRGWQIAAPVAAAVLAAILLGPQLRSWHSTSLPSQAAAPGPIAVQDTPARVAAERAKTSPALSPPAAPLVAPPSPPAARAASEAARAAVTPAPAPTRAGAAADLSASSSLPAANSDAAAAPSANRNAELQENTTATDEETAASRGSQDELLRQAAVRGNAARVRELLEAHLVPVDSPDSHGRTALLLAILYRREAVARELLKLGADPNVRDIEGRTALSIAQAQGDPAMVHALVQAGAR